MRYLIIDELYHEIQDLMANNFKGTGKQRFKQAKKTILESVKKAIEDNKEDILKHFSA